MKAEELIHELSAVIDNTKAPRKRSDKAAYQRGFRDCFVQVIRFLESKKLPQVTVGQKLYACLSWDNNKMQVFEVSPGTNKRSLLLRAYDEDGMFHLTTGNKYSDINKKIFFTKEEAKRHPIL